MTQCFLVKWKFLWEDKFTNGCVFETEKDAKEYAKACTDSKRKFVVEELTVYNSDEYKIGEVVHYETH